MIRHLQEQRNQNLGTLFPLEQQGDISSSTLPPVPKDARTAQEPPGAERLSGRKYYFGDTFAQEVLSALALNFKQLEQLYLRSDKPVLDVGASYSTLAIEGTFRNIPIFGTDLRYDTSRHGLLSGIERRVGKLADHYLHANDFPAGFECYSIPETAWHECVQHGLALVDSRMVECCASEIKLPNGKRADDRYFSTVLSHHAVPKFSNREEFFTQELRELLRVTDDRLHLFPLVTAGPGDGLIHIPGSAGRRQLEEVAREAGFSLEVKVSPTCVGCQKDPGFDMLGIFVRHQRPR